MPSFKDFPDFKPDLTPKQIFKAGAFGGTYWRPIYSSVLNKNVTVEDYPEIIKILGQDVVNKNITSFESYDKNINKYNVKVGSTLEFWESHNWINPIDPYGWVQWYTMFYNGRRTDDDKRQIRRWMGIAGPRGRFTLYMKNKVQKTNLKPEDISPKICQVLLHWGVSSTSI